MENRDTSSTVSRILAEDILTLSAAREELSRVTGVRPDKATIIRWIHRGARGVRLEAVRIGARNIFTSKQALTRFIEAQTRILTRK